MHLTPPPVNILGFGWFHNKCFHPIREGVPVSINLRTACALVVGLFLFTDRAEAQIVTISRSGFVAGPPPKADPQGTWSVPANSGPWKVVFEYGIVTDGTFTRDLTIGTGGTVNLPAAGGNGTWGPFGRETLKNPLPAGTSVRAQLFKQVNGNWGMPVATAYEPVAVAPPPPKGE